MSTEGKKDDTAGELIGIVLVVLFFIFSIGGGLKGCGDFLWYGSKGPPAAPYVVPPLKW
jgi:hypothetical protein